MHNYPISRTTSDGRQSAIVGGKNKPSMVERFREAVRGEVHEGYHGWPSTRYQSNQAPLKVGKEKNVSPK